MKNGNDTRRHRVSEEMLSEYDFDYAKAKPNRFAGRIANKTINKPNQRVGSISNSRVGADFERVALKFFARQGIELTRNFPLDVGLSGKKRHYFDLGSGKPK